MKRLALSLAVFASLSSGGLAQTTGPVTAFMPAAANQSSIPPNCTLDPWTGRLTCHIWPTCTIDPWTGKMTCPVPRLAPRIL